MIHFGLISSCTFKDFAIRLPLLRLFISFYIDLSVQRYLTLGLHTGRGRLLVWESSITFNIGHPYIQHHTNRRIRRFAITDFHSDHYVRLAAWLAQRCPWLAEYRYADTDGYNDYYIGHIKPFNWLCIAIRQPNAKVEQRWTID